MPNIKIAGSDLYWTVAAVAIYYLAAWSIVGRKGREKSVVVRYQAPEGLSPAAIRHVYTMHSDGRSYAAIVAHLAARKLLAIVPGKEHGAIYIEKLADHRVLRSVAEEEGQQAEFDTGFIPYAIALDLREGWGDELGIKTMVETEL